MLEQLVQATTGGIVNQFTPPKEIPGRDASATAMQQSPLGKRFVRSNYVYSDAPKEADSSLREQANLNVEERRSGGKLLDELSQLPPDKRAERAAQLSPIELKSVEQEWKGRQSRSFDAEIQKIKLMDTEHAIRAKYIFDRVNSLEGEERKKFAEELKASGVLSSGVLKQLDILARK
jgi:phage-related protein